MIFRGIFQADSIPVLERVLSFTEARHRVLAANVANAETPGYRRKDLAVKAFNRRLIEAIERRRTEPGRFVMGPVPKEARAQEAGLNAGMLRHDGNNVDIDREMALLARNALLHNTVAALLRAKYGALRRAVSGRSTTA